MADTNEKQVAAIKSLEYIEDDCVLGVGTGSTINFLISELHQVRHKIKSIVSSSEASTQLLSDEGFMIEDLSSTGSPDLYIEICLRINGEGVSDFKIRCLYSATHAS